MEVDAKNVEIEIGAYAHGWAAHDSTALLSPFTFRRRSPRDNDVCINILYCGICFSDLACARNEYGWTMYPLVPGHEIVGIAINVGSDVKNVKVGDHVGVGYVINSCNTCESCLNHKEQYCKQKVPVFSGIDYDGFPTYGGFSNYIVVNERFVVRIPENLPLDTSTALLCAGITTYSPLQNLGLTDPSKTCGVVGLGGLGHLAVKFAKAYGQKVTVISTSSTKKKDALELLGADSFILSNDLTKLEEASQTLDYIIDTIPGDHRLDPLLSLLQVDGRLILVGSSSTQINFDPVKLILGRLSIHGSFVGNAIEIQQMLEFCGKHNIVPIIEKIKIKDINNAMSRLAKGEVKYRFVVDFVDETTNS